MSIKFNIKDSDFILVVLDSRDPLRTIIKKSDLNNIQQKDFIYILSKSDLIPNWVLRKWIKIFSTYGLILYFSTHYVNTKNFKRSLTVIFNGKKKAKKNLRISIIGKKKVGKTSFIRYLKNKVNKQNKFGNSMNFTKNISIFEWTFLTKKNVIYMHDKNFQYFRRIKNSRENILVQFKKEKLTKGGFIYNKMNKCIRNNFSYNQSDWYAPLPNYNNNIIRNKKIWLKSFIINLL
ncbi:putative GTP-binding protein [Guillardia theta]|uniref:GTP-binding protein n=1 Tax=Guillardia theta TaxID=55529 RepID=Q9AVW9_GUITH|nr:putative GTP-binding protein [Guillardia theta]CAC27102.1 putative GTP-binding protein [Guillardia theta]|mmetsp:Transcript_26273/g.86337  ORF Transcript_26273/g.86337 Transcript_26273/m.86337 type:complete len:234 (+) Transcript_26273:5668-6369(+)